VGEADQVVLGVPEVPDDEPHSRNLVRAAHPPPAETLGLGERGLDVGDLDVEGDVAGVAVRVEPVLAPVNVPS
jgi:hypothetical protein